VYQTEPGALADRTNPAMRGSAIETLAVTTLQDRPFAALADGKIDRARRSRHERDGRGLVALANDAQRPMSSLEPEILDVGGACFALQRLLGGQAAAPTDRRLGPGEIATTNDHARCGALSPRS
jgi:hypothetical protein